MRRVKNQKVLKKLSQRIVQSRKKKNIISLAAILLTTILFTTVFSVGGSLLKSNTESTLRQVGGSTHTGYKNMTWEEYEKVKQDKAVRDLSYNIMVGVTTNTELNKIQGEVRYFEPLDAKHSFSYPTVGNMPKKEEEAAMSTIVLDALGVRHEIGEKLTLDIQIHGVVQTKTFTLCGYWEGDSVSRAQEILVSKEWAEKVAPIETTPFYETDQTDYSGYMNVNFNFSNAFDIEKKTVELTQRLGFDPNKVNTGVNWAYGFSSVDVSSILMLVVLLGLIMLSGYLIIYNIFYLNIFRDIRFYGLLKTIGTTGKQLKKIVRKQAWQLCLLGIPAGLLLGWLTGRFFTPFVVNMLDGVLLRYSANPLIFIGSALFTILTVYISCIKPCRMAAKVSPIEAVRFTEQSRKKKNKNKKTKRATPFRMAMSNLRRNTKKLVLVVFSLSLSLILLNSAYTIVTGFDMDKFLSSYLVSDFMATDVSMKNLSLSYVEYEGVTEEFLSELQEQEGVENIGHVYVCGNDHVYSDAEWERLETIMEDPAYADWFGDYHLQESFDNLRTDRTTDTDIYGVNKEAADKIILADGQKMDWEKFRTGKYVIVNAMDSTNDGKVTFHSPFLEPGDTVTLEFEEGKAKEYEVLYVGQMPMAMGTQMFPLIPESFILPDTEMKEQTGVRQPMRTIFDVEDGQREAVGKWLADYCENVDPNMAYGDKAEYEKEFDEMRKVFVIAGGLLSVILALIGILNFVNVTVTSILARRQELAMLEAIGMTGKQQRSMLRDEGIMYGILTILVSASAGSAIGYFLVETVAGQMWMFSWHFTLLPILLCIPLLLAISVAVPEICYRNACKNTVVERLRITQE
ncbi:MULTISPECIES: ABC transporter permease [Lachnospiraceae]|jgi:putative ABC transport system permease protein|uniref:FtsX-like permease family protein n=1 Tax=Faecalicatena acetigenes TaxID=2981790 RepID=A0ABT2T8K1_9FIRM|nr:MULTISPECIES: FtsX-like permease family protein [Lachnospiraceae]MCU6746247.1 FtsX-like permease family protein [Faecalicatena acetigenes]SCH03422.1 acidobacterial duplicated orphan permease [uncultured Clostridium sp.]